MNGKSNISNIRSAVLEIDTKDNQCTHVVLVVDGKKYSVSKKTEVWTSQHLLPIIAQLINTSGISVSQIKEIHVDLGPGSFTGLRVGVSVANAIGWLLHIPVNGKSGTIISPIYQ